MPIIVHLFNIGGSRKVSRVLEKKLKYKDWKAKAYLSLFTFDIIIYIDNPLESTHKLLDVITGFSYVADYTNIKSRLPFYTSAINNLKRILQHQ